MFFSEVLGLGTDTLMLVITNEQNIGYLLALLFGKLILTSLCIGFGFFGGTFSELIFVSIFHGFGDPWTRNNQAKP